MAQNGEVNPGVVPLKFGWKKNRGSKPERPPVRDRIPTSKVREAVSTEKNIYDVMDSKDLYACISCSPINIVLWLAALTYLALILDLSLLLIIPSQRYWLLPVMGSLVTPFSIFHVLLYVFLLRRRVAIPCLEAGATVANAVTPPLSPRPSPPLPTSVAAVA